jgi:hypothetical protein
MLPDDVFRTKFDHTVSDLRQWSGALTDCARVEEEDAARYWRIAVRPLAAGACPLELILHHRQRCDLAIGEESYEDRAVDEFDLLLPIAEAIAAGRVLARHKTSANTGAALAIETHVRLADGQVWQADRRLRPRSVPGRTILEDRWFLPYRR